MNESDPPDRGRTESDIAQGIANVVDAALDVGVSLARVFAETSGRGRSVTEPAAGTSPVGVMIHYGLATLGNVTSAVTAALGVGRSSTMASTAATTAGGAHPTGPRVMKGATLRVPLSVENRGESSMQGLEPRVRGLRREGRDVSTTFAPDAFRFSPALFAIAPKDFEKLTVFVDVPTNASEGEYQLVLALGPSEPDLSIIFSVIGAAESPEQ